MICPKCNREMGYDSDTCPYCGFTFLTPKSTGVIHSIPYYSAQVPVEQPTPTFTPIQTAPDQRVPDFDSFQQRVMPEPLSTLRYIGLLLLGLIPIAGFVVYIILVASRDGNPNQRHFAAAMLILKAVGIFFLLGAAIVYIVYATPLFFYFFR